MTYSKTLKVLPIVILLFLGCNTSGNGVISVDVDSASILRIMSEDTPNIMELANDIVNDNISLGSTWPSFKYEGDLNWFDDPFKNSSWKSTFFSLRMIGILSAAYESDQDKVFLEKAKEILYSWDANFDKEELLKRRGVTIWNDHVVSDRVINLSHFHFVLSDSGELDSYTEFLITKHLLEYGDWLEDDKNYTAGNHAVMIDRALLYLSYIIEIKEKKTNWKNKALKRFDVIMDDEVTEDGVCVENSPEYHLFVMNLIKAHIELRESFGEEPDSKYLALLDKMKTYLVYVLKPNLVYPFQGDTYPIGKGFHFSQSYPDSRFDFLESKGQSGKEPEKTDIVFEEAGYAIFRDDWKIGEAFKTASYLNFIGGFPSRIHKHSDNLSFSLFANKEDILIDPGSWGYAKNDTVSYLKSTFAHNTFTINNTSYRKSPVRSCEILSYDLQDDYAIVDGVYRPNPFEEFYRKLIFIKPNLIFIDDHVFSSKGINTTQQIFNLGRTLDTVSINENGKGLKANFKYNNVSIRQLSNDDFDIKHYTGKDTIRGLYALRTEMAMEGNQMVFHTKHNTPISQFNYRTLIEIENNLQTNVAFVDIESDENGFDIHWKDPIGKEKNMKVDIRKRNRDVFEENLEKSKMYPIYANDIAKNYGIEALGVIKWTNNEYSLLIKFSNDCSEEQLKKFTIGIKGYAHDYNKKSLSTYARSTGRDHESWNIMKDNFVNTPSGKFVSINISTKLKKFKRWKMFLFDRDGYKRELWNYEIDDFYLDSDLKNKELMAEIENGTNIDSSARLSEDFGIERMYLSKNRKNDKLLYIKLDSSTTDSILEKYKIGLHTYVAQGDTSKLMEYSKAKGRNYDAWDFTPKIKKIGNDKFIAKKISSDIDNYQKIKLFLYSKNGYNGIIGKPFEIKNVHVK